MAIKLEIHDYCDKCMDFCADVERPVRMYSGHDIVNQTDTVIRCIHRGQCEAIRRYLEEDLKKKSENPNA